MPLLLVALLLVFAVPAQAKSPPQGNYSCFIGSYYQLFGSIKIDGVNEFIRFGKTGTYAAGKRKGSFSVAP